MSTARTTMNKNKNENKHEIETENRNENKVQTGIGKRTEPSSSTDHRLRWPEALAITLALLLAGAVAAGAFRPMLPWLG